MLLSLNIAQLILYIGGLSLIGQALLFVLSGQKRDTNLFYQLFQILNKPWTGMARFISPKQIADHQIPFVVFCILAILYIVVTLAKIEHCVSIGIELCQ